MIIRSNYKINENKYKEFIHTLFKDNNDEVYIEDKSSNSYIHFKLDDTEFKLPILFEYEKQKQAMFKTILLKKYKLDLAWGGLVGVRPTKLVHSFLEDSFDYEQIRQILKKVYILKNEKIDLLLSIVKNSIDYIDKDTIALYIGLAFCPTKCTYCSFPAYLKQGKYEQIYEEYFSTLLKEIIIMGDIVKELDLKINTLYIGGGTPSYLNCKELIALLDSIKNSYNLSYLEEFTFEAGRIDTLDDEKLNILKEYGVSRISINPQSFKDSTLKIVNRYHDIDKLNKIYKKAKDLNFVINMDFIFGLPKESTQDILNTIDKMYEYDAENLTIHNLSMKKASYLTKSKYSSQDELDYKKIYKKLFELTRKKGYIPYYMYRQKNSYIEGENIGFCKDTYQSIYNIDMIEENKNVFSIGAGAYTKLISKKDIIRIVSPKDPIAYVKEFKERIIKKKEEILKFYEKK